MKILEYQGDIVMTTKILAYIYGTDESNIRTNFSRNKERYIEGKHYYRLTGKVKEDYLRELHYVTNKQDHSAFYLWTQKGALLHAKSLNTDQAWQTYEALIDQYYELHMLLIERKRKENNLTTKEVTIAIEMFIAAKDGSKVDAKTLLLITEAMQKDE